MLHGGDYNPEQWLDCPEILEEDLKLMKEAGVNCVTLGVFSWAVLEPEEGVYDFDWLEEIIDNLGREGIQVILATPSGAMPHWLTQKYPEVMQVGADGRRNLPGRRHNFCYTSPVMRKKIKALNEALSGRFGRKENIILWHISNELGGNFGDGACHCELCQEAFRKWLKEKYGTLEALNHAWWGRFWSHVYTDWSQIHSPSPHGENTVTALDVDWRRFVTEQMSDYCGAEIQAVRKYSDLPATTNFMDTFKNLDYNRLQKELDSMRRRYDELSALFKRLYEDNVLGRVSDEQFRMLSADYNAEQKNLSADIPAKEEQLEKLKASAANVDAFIEKAKQYTAIDELTPQLLRLFIQRIEIGERSKKHSRSAGQSVRIVYRDIGALDTPMREGDHAPRMTKEITEKEAIIRLLA